jgi:hypothetical protein
LGRSVAVQFPKLKYYPRESADPSRIPLLRLTLRSAPTMLLTLVFLPLGSYTLYNAFCLYANYVKASKLGLPLVVVPITPDNPLWFALQTAFGGALRYVPFELFSFTRHCRTGWEFHDRYKTHDQLGDAWVLVTPARIWLYVANAAAVTDIFGRGKDFTRPVWMLGI